MTVTGGSSKRVSLAALVAVKEGRRPRLVFRVHAARRGDKRKGFTEQDCARLLDAAHQQLGGPLVVVWDNLSTHVSKAMKELITLVKTRLRRIQYRSACSSPSSGAPGSASRHPSNPRN